MFLNLTRACLLLALLLTFSHCFAQNLPDSISYQAIVRDINGDELANQSVTIEFAIRADAPDGLIVFEEFHDLVPTNQFGLFSVFIGAGVPTGNGVEVLLSAIDWHTGKYFLEVRATLPGTGDTQILGTSELLTVPYAFHANTATTVLNEADGAIGNEVITSIYQDGLSLVFEEGDASYAFGLDNLYTLLPDDNPENELIENISVQDDTMLVVTEGGISTSHNVSEIAFATWQKENDAVHNNSMAVGINTASPQSALHVNGSLGLTMSVINAPGTYTLGTDVNENVTVIIANVTGGNTSLYMPSASSCEGRIYKFKKRDDNASGNNFSLLSAANEIEGTDDFTLGSNWQMEFATLMSDGSMWYIIDYSFYVAP